MSRIFDAHPYDRLTIPTVRFRKERDEEEDEEEENNERDGEEGDEDDDENSGYSVAYPQSAC